jgi:hypothetical protein
MSRILLFACMLLMAKFFHRRATHKNVTSLSCYVWLVAAFGAVMMLSSCGTDLSSSYALNVFVTGLTGSGLQVTLNGGAPISVSANSQTTLARLTNGAAYTVAITAQPVSPLQTCTEAIPSGTIANNNVDVMISCVAAGVVVPSVLGMTQAVASTAITGAGLVLGTVTMQPNNTVASGTVISENPAAGTSVATGSSVNLVVSSGGAPTLLQVLQSLQATGVLPTLDTSSSVAGTDANQNGIRDDIDALIAGLPDTPAQQAALSQEARNLQTTLTVDTTNASDLNTLGTAIDRGVACVYLQYPSATAGDRLKWLQMMTANTPARIQAYLAFNQAMNGYVSHAATAGVCGV